MKKTLEKLWNDCYADECAQMDSEEEKELLQKAIRMHKAVSETLTREQGDALEKYVEAFYELQAFLLKKVFFKGCELAVSFFLEAGNFKDE